MSWVEKDLKDHLVSTSLPQAGLPTLAVVQIDQGPIKPGLEHPLQAWGIHNLSAQPVSVPHHSLSGKLHPDVSSKSSLLEFKIISPCCHFITGLQVGTQEV